MARKAPLTKSGILSVIARIYDPLGLLAPRVSTLKFIFQSLCNNEKNLDWDLKTQFLDWLSDLETMPTLSIQRCYFKDVIDDPISVELDGFGDARGFSVAAAVYLRILTLSSIHTLSVASKNRVSAFAKVPGAELMSEK